ncbi:MAG: glutaredoxin family protein, partial [Chloroflexi bacterium]|nr:glutaredoxin family protein [Chloroflexota bacterium]
MTTKTITVYTQPGCAPCLQVKAFLQDRHVPFTEKNVQDDLMAIRELMDLGVMSTPATVIDGELVTGF